MAITIAGDFAIGRLSERAGVNIETIRYYERIGLLPRPARRESGHRAYGEADVRRLKFVRRCRELGFSLDDVRVLLGLAAGDDASCDEVREITRHHMRSVDAKIADLVRISAALGEMAAACETGNLSHCPVIEALFDEKS